MNARNYQRELDAITEQIEKESRVPRLLLHACCAPCSSYCLEYLTKYFSVTVYFYNPNIYPEEEYHKRVAEIRRFISEFPASNPVSLLEGRYEPERFYEMAKGLENVPEGGERCFKCFRLRLDEAARVAAEGGFDYFTTTLSISPKKNAAKLNEAGEEAALACGVKWLPSDFKKRDGYRRSVELSKEYGLYRQNYCGCEFSARLS